MEKWDKLNKEFDQALEDDQYFINIKHKAMKQRLEEIREEIRNERVSIGELIELRSLIEYIDKDDVELLEWAGVPEFKND